MLVYLGVESLIQNIDTIFNNFSPSSLASFYKISKVEIDINIEGNVITEIEHKNIPYVTIIQSFREKILHKHMQIQALLKESGKDAILRSGIKEPREVLGTKMIL